MTTDAQIVARHDKLGPSGLVVRFPGDVFQAGMPDRLVGLPTTDLAVAEKTADEWAKAIRRRMPSDAKELQS